MKKAILVVCLAICCVAVRGYAAEPVSYGPVKSGENLYRIALKHQQPGLTVSQTMTLIFEANPGAFEQGDINLLKVGSTLTIPDPEAGATGATSGQAVGAAAEPTGAATQDPGLAAGAAVATETGQAGEVPSAAEVAEPQAAQQSALPEPSPPKRKKKQPSKPSTFRYSYDISLIDDDNVRLAQHDEDIRSDYILSAKVKARGGKSLDSFSILNYGGSAAYNKFDTFDTLDNYEIEVNTRYRFALNSGFTAPIYSLGAKIGGREFDTEMRDATFVSLSADLNKWLTNTINMTTGLVFNAQESKSEVFDTSDARIFVNLDTNFSKTDLVYTTLSLITGDTVSSASPTLDIINVADAIEPDDAFGGVEANQFAYRLEADTVVVTLGYNRILTRDLSFDISARYVDSVARDADDIYYDRTIFRASLLGRF
jgi:FimV-like protein